MLLDGVALVVDWFHAEYVLVDVQKTVSQVKPTEPSVVGVVPIVNLRQQT